MGDYVKAQHASAERRKNPVPQIVLVHEAPGFARVLMPSAYSRGPGGVTAAACRVRGSISLQRICELRQTGAWARQVGAGFRKRSHSTNNVERDDGSSINHRALAHVECVGLWHFSPRSETFMAGRYRAVAIALSVHAPGVHAKVPLVAQLFRHSHSLGTEVIGGLRCRERMGRDR